jgi:phage gp46-like protein
MVSCIDFISFIFRNVFPAIIHNRCSNFELVSPAYFSHNGIWIRSPDQKVDTNTITSASFGRDETKDKFTSALLYKLQRKKSLESNVSNTSTEDTSTSLQLLIMWKSNDWYNFSVRALLVKHSNVIMWNEDTLKKLHSMHRVLLDKGLSINFGDMLREHYSIEDTWLLDDSAVLITTTEWEKENRRFEITLSEGTREDDYIEPLCVPSSIYD